MYLLGLLKDLYRRATLSRVCYAQMIYQTNAITRPATIAIIYVNCMASRVIVISMPEVYQTDVLRATPGCAEVLRVGSYERINDFNSLTTRERDTTLKKPPRI